MIYNEKSAKEKDSDRTGVASKQDGRDWADDTRRGG